MTDEKTQQPDNATIELTQKYERERDRANNALGKLTDIEKTLEKYKGVDLDRLKADSEALRLLQTEKAKNSGNQADIDTLLADTEKRIRNELQPLLDQTVAEKTKYASQVKELTVVDGAMGKIGNKFNDDMQSYVKQIVRDNVDVDENGNFYIKGKDGKPRYANNAANKPMTLEEFADELATKHPSMAKSTVPAGAMQNGQRTYSGDITPDRFMKMTPEQRAQIPAQERQKLAVAALKH